jgi:hypothetical protein
LKTIKKDGLEVYLEMGDLYANITKPLISACKIGYKILVPTGCQ